MTSVKSGSSYTPYVALAVRQWLNSADPEAKHRVMAGSAVFADISGFTKLSERLDRIGLEGAEQVTEVIGNAFNTLLEPAYSYDGQLIKFGGDALLLFYSGDDHELRAASSALEMRRALRGMGSIETPAGKVTLRMSQGVHGGDFHFFLVGDTFRELIMAGSATSHIGRVEGEAGAGQIIVSDTTARALPSKNLGAKKAVGRLLRGELLPLEESSQTVYSVDDDLTLFVPSALRDPIARDAMVPEHRPATSAFIRFTGVDALLDRDPETVTDIFEELINDVEAATRPRRIGVLNTDVYPDGLKILLSAGAPITTGEDEENMLLALREIVEKERALPLHVGVTRGPVFAADVGTTFRRGYTVMGDQVNLAARLMSRAAPNQILATDPVLQGSRTLFGTEALEPFMVKGKSKPIQAYAVGAARGARVDTSGRDTPLVGRDDELEMLRGLWDQTKKGSGALVLVGGGHGTGKSRLVGEFAASVDDDRTFSAEARRYRSSTPYFAATLLLSEVLGIDRYHPEGQEERLIAVVDEVAPELRPYRSLIGTALGLDLPESQAELTLAQEFRKAKLEESVVALLGAVLTEPTLLWVDDAQWADDASADLLKAIALATAERPWLLAVSGRRIEQAAEAREVTAPTLSLGPLSDEAATAIVHVCTEDAPLAPHVTAEIVERAQGNPMFLNELLAAVESDSVEALPESIEGLVVSRIDSLLPEDRNALRELSVLGTGFRPEFADVVLSEPASTTVFNRLSAFLDVEPVWIKFNNSLVHQAAYGGLPYRQRRELHGQVAESIERSNGSADLLSVHYSAAARWPETWKYARIAGDHAKEIYANLEAASFYGTALDAGTREFVGEAQLLAVARELAQVNERAGAFGPALNALSRAARHTNGDPLALANIHHERARVRARTGHYSSALRETTKGYQLAAPLQSPEAAAARARLDVFAALVRLQQGRPRQALEKAERSLPEAEAVGELKVMAQAYTVLEGAYEMLGQPENAVYADRALEIYDELDDLNGKAAVANNSGVRAYDEGRWEDAIHFYRTAEESSHRAGNEPQAAAAAANMGEVLVSQRRLAEAEAVLPDAVRTLRGHQLLDIAIFAEIQLARLESAKGDVEAAEARLAKLRTEAEEVGQIDVAFEAAIRRADVLVRKGDAAAALDLLDRVEEIAGEEAEWYAVPATRIRAKALGALGHREEAAQLIGDGLAAARDESLIYEEALLLQLRAEMGPNGTQDAQEADRLLERLGVVRSA